MAENKTKQLFTDLTTEESYSINGGNRYCYYDSYQPSSYYYKKSSYDYHYASAYHSGSPRYCY